MKKVHFLKRLRNATVFSFIFQDKVGEGECVGSLRHAVAATRGKLECHAHAGAKHLLRRGEELLPRPLPASSRCLSLTVCEAPAAAAPHARPRAPRRHELVDTLPQSNVSQEAGVCPARGVAGQQPRVAVPQHGAQRRPSRRLSAQCLPRGLAWPPRQHKRIMKIVNME